VDAILFLFSIVDKTSFDDLHQQISRLSSPDDNVAKLAVATKYPFNVQKTFLCTCTTFVRFYICYVTNVILLPYCVKYDQLICT